MQQQHTICDFHSSDSWVILSPIEQSIKRKIEAEPPPPPLKDWDIQINYGIKTGCNEAFIISTEKRREILERTSDYRPDLPYDFTSPTATLPEGYDPQGEFARTAELIRGKNAIENVLSIRKLFENRILDGVKHGFHTSGHADVATLYEVCKEARPSIGVIPIHKDTGMQYVSDNYRVFSEGEFTLDGIEIEVH